MASTTRKLRSGKPPDAQRKGAGWAVLAPGELARPGSTLLALLLEAANTRGLSMRQLAEQGLGVSYGYLAALRNGEKEIPNLGDDAIAQATQFLGLPKVVVMLAASQLKLEDFYQDRDLLHAYLQPALQFIQRDPELGAYMPPDAFTTTLELQQFLVFLYERATGKTLIPSKVSLAEIAERYKTLTEIPRR